MDVLVIGALGMLGRDLVDTLLSPPLEYNVTAWDIDDIDIRNGGEVEEKVGEWGRGSSSPVKYVVNCAAYTDVDGAEVEKELSYEINAVGAKNIATAAKKAGAKTVYISTDYIFGGEKLDPIGEDELTEPINHYGSTKLAGEKLTVSADPDALIVRAQWLFGPLGKNFVETMLNLAKGGGEIRVVDDQVGSPTYTMHFADAVGRMIGLSLSGVYHVSNSGKTSWYRFAEEIFRLAGMDVELTPITTDQYIGGANKVVAKRPANSVFDMGKLRTDAGLTMKDWREGLSEYLTRRGVLK